MENGFGCVKIVIKSTAFFVISFFQVLGAQTTFTKMVRRITIETDPSEELSEFELNHIMELFKNLKNFELEIKKKHISPSNPVTIPYIPTPWVPNYPQPNIWYKITSTDAAPQSTTYKFSL